MKKYTVFFRSHIRLIIISVLALLIIMSAVLAPAIVPYDPYESVLRDALKSPDKVHIFGTDLLGRDIFSRIIYGTRTSITSTLFVLGIVFVIGLILGLISGYFGGAVDAVIMRVADTMIAFPDLILAIAIAGILGPDMINSVVAIAAVSWPRYARLARSMVLKIKNRDYITAAYVTGSKNIYLFRAYFLPNVLPTMIITAATDIGTFMLSLASLSFLGFGVQPPTPEWGYMLSEGRNYLQSAPWLMLYPGIAIFIFVVVFNLLGEQIRDMLDPKSRSKSLIPEREK